MESPMSRLSLSLPLGSLLLALLSTRSPCAAPQPPLPAIDLPHSYECGQRRAELVSRWRADRLRVDGLPPALPRVCRRLSRRRARRAGASHGREPEPAAALLLQRLRPRDQPDLDTRRQVDRVRL